MIGTPAAAETRGVLSLQPEVQSVSPLKRANRLKAEFVVGG
jgi:hypothetical protein